MKCIVRALLPPRRLTSGGSHGSSSSRLKDRIRKSFSSEDEPPRISMNSTILDECSVASSLSDIISEHEWVRLHLDEPLPSPRSKHAAVAVGENMYVFGGRSAEGVIGDIQMLDTRSLLWSRIPEDAGATSHGTAPHFVGHFVAKWKSMFIVLGGESSLRSSVVTVHAFDFETESWSSLTPTGDIPLARIGQSIVQVATKLIMFGGEDASGRILDEFYILDLETLVWESPKTGGMKPPPRKYHAAGCHGGRYLWIFGGKSYATYYRDVFCLDLMTMEWTKEKTKGSVPQIGRARHVGVLVGENFYVVGGENRGQEMVDTLVFDVVRREWSIVTMIESMSPLAHDGLSVVHLERDERHYLVAFGGHGTLLSNQLYAMLVTTSSRSSDTIHKHFSRSRSEFSIRTTKERPKTTSRSRGSPSPTCHFQLQDASPSSSSMDLSCTSTTPSDHEKRISFVSEKNMPSVTSLAHMEDVMTMMEEVVKSDGNFGSPVSPLGRNSEKPAGGCAGETESNVLNTATKANHNGRDLRSNVRASDPKGNDLVRNNLIHGDPRAESSRFPSSRKAAHSVSLRASSKRFDNSSCQDLDGSNSVNVSIPTGTSKRWITLETHRGELETAPADDHYLATALQTVRELHRQVELLHTSKEEQEKDLQLRFRSMEAMASKLEETMQQQERTERKLQETMRLQKETEKKLQEVSQLQKSAEKRYHSVKQQMSDIENEYRLCSQQKEDLEKHLKALSIRDD